MRTPTPRTLAHRIFLAGLLGLGVIDLPGLPSAGAGAWAQDPPQGQGPGPAAEDDPCSGLACPI